MKKLFTALLSFTTVALSAKSNDTLNVHLSGLPACGFEHVLNKAGVAYPDLIGAYRNNTSAAATVAKTTDVVYDIPIVFHIVYPASQPTWNLPDSVIANQVDILNKAYRKQHADTGNVRSYFKGLSGDAHIQFHLATVDPNGNPTNGITRTVTARRYFGNSNFNVAIDSLENMKHTATGGIDAWPIDKYFNVWVGNMSDSMGQLSILGYGIPPLNPVPGNNWPSGLAAAYGADADGVEIQVHAIGDNSALNPALQGIYTKGRALVHESGHYLGLQHVFGSNGDPSHPDCGALADDGIGDTPTQGTNSIDNTSKTNCPLDTKNTCGNGTAGDLPDMWEDYMDYARDACQTMFTNGQIAIMRSVLASQRSSLTSPTAVNNVPVTMSFGIYPNPVTNMLSIKYAGTISSIRILDAVGRTVLYLKGPAANTKQYNVGTFLPGNYFVVVESSGQQMTNKVTIVH